MAASPELSSSRSPDTLTRVLAFLIDGVIAGVLSNIPVIGGLLGAGYFVVRDGLTLDVMNERSLGKHLMGLRVERLDGRPMDIETSVRRNWMWGIGPVASTAAAVPLFGGLISVAVALLGLVVGLYEAYRVLAGPDGRRWGDDLAGTRVTE